MSFNPTESEPAMRSGSASRDIPGPQTSAMTPSRELTLGDIPSNRGFVAMLTAYRATGGAARGDDLARLLEDCRLGSVASLARLVVSGTVFGFEWRHTFWVPMFQFNLRDLSIKPGPAEVVEALGADFDGWALAAWFARPNSWLNDAMPVDLLESDLPAVLEAARADRFVAAG
jgi:hypothetical protein